MAIAKNIFLKRFLKDTSANVSLLFAGTCMTLLAATGLAVDFIGVQNAQTELQAQVDATVLALAKSEITDVDELNTLALLFMQGNGYSPEMPAPVARIDADGVVRVDASTEYDVTVMRVLGHDKAIVEAFAESAIGAGSAGLEIALVLDTTESMDGNKIDALRLAAGNLVRSFDEDDSENVRVALVPFGEYVNVDSVGMNNRNAPWIDVPADWSETETYIDRNVITDGYCKVARSTRSYMQDGVLVEDNNYCSDWEGAVYDAGVEATRIREHTWNGCVGSRDSGLHMRDNSYATRIPGLLDEHCADPIVPLTNDYDSVADAIDDMDVQDSTYMPAGLMWGQRVLSPLAPYSEGSSDVETQKILIMMTDGLNTMVLGNNNRHDNLDMSVPSEAARANATNNDTAQLCRTIKQAGTTVYTIAFEVPDTPTKNMLRRCASSNGNYFDATGSDELVAAFSAIVSQLTAVRITK